MIGWFKSLFTREDDIYSGLPSNCTFDKNAGVVIISHRGMKGYFTREMILEFKKSDIDYVRYWMESVDEFLDEIDEEELQ